MSPRRVAGALAIAFSATVAAAATLGCGSASGPPKDGTAATLQAQPELNAAARRADLRRALPLIGVSARSLGYHVDLAPRRDPDLRALTDTDTRTITLYIARNDAPHRTAHDLAHEIGHAYDAVHMTDASRRAYLARRGVPHARWWPDRRRSASDYSVGAGDFAEIYALCHAASPEFRSTLAPRPADPCAVLPAAARTQETSP